MLHFVTTSSAIPLKVCLRGLTGACNISPFKIMLNMPAQSIQKTLKNEVFSHIFNKGVENRNLFNDEQDYEVFLGYLSDYLSVPPDPEKTKKSFSVNGRTYKGVPHQPKNYFNKVELVSYSLKPGHFHLLIHQLSMGSLEKFMRSLSTRYAIYYNKKYKRRGSLFSGPYKSIQIENVSQLLHLTRYLHLEHLKKDGKRSKHTDYSSYKGYIGTNKASWLNPKVVLSYFDKAENDYFKGVNGYKNFVEKYELKDEERKMLERIIIESELKHLERRILKAKKSKSFKASRSRPSPEPRLRIPEFAASSAIVFALLFTIGIRNINTSAIASLPSPTPQVSGIEVVGDVEPEPEPKDILVITISDGSKSVNIRQKPSTESKIVAKAIDEETFEYVSKYSEWYRIKLDDKSTAFVSIRYAKIQKDIERDK